MLYSDKVMDHFEHPRNVGEIENADGVGQVGNPKCGDIMKMYLKMDGDVITDVKFKTFGCGSAIATSSMATEMIKGKTIGEAMELTNAAVAEALDGLPGYKMHCSVLAEEAIKAALADYYKRQGKEVPETLRGPAGDGELGGRCPGGHDFQPPGGAGWPAGGLFGLTVGQAWHRISYARNSALLVLFGRFPDHFYS